MFKTLFKTKVSIMPNYDQLENIPTRNYDQLENIANKRESFQNRMTLIVFTALLLVGIFLVGIGAYITILEITTGMKGGIEKYIFLFSGVMVILFGSQLTILRISKHSSDNKYMQ